MACSMPSAHPSQGYNLFIALLIEQICTNTCQFLDYYLFELIRDEIKNMRADSAASRWGCAGVLPPRTEITGFFSIYLIFQNFYNSWDGLRRLSGCSRQ